jgi:PAS domain S-box-containing protein
VLLGVYFVAGKLGLMLAFVHANATAVWPPTGIALAAFMLFGFRVWPAILLGAFLVNLTTAGSVATSLGIAVGNSLEGLLGAVLVERFAHGRNVFDRAPDCFKFIGLAALLSTTVSATVGPSTLALGGYASWDRLGAIWLTWWLGDAAGALIVAPVLLLWGRDVRVRWSPARAFEATLLFLVLVVVGGLVFDGMLSTVVQHRSLTFLCVPPLVWAAFRFGPREAATAIALLSGIAIWGTLHGSGPFVAETQNESLLLLQAFMGTMAAMTLSLAAVVAEHRRIEAALARVAAIVEYSDDAILSTTLHGVITSWNGGAERLYGHASSAVIGRPLSIIIPSEQASEPPRILGQIRRGELIDNYDTVRLKKDGSRVDVSVTVSPIRGGGGRIVGASVIARDITERKEAEAARQERDILRSVASLAAAAAHEINNPLTAVMGHAQLLAHEIGAGSRRHIDEMLTAIYRIRDILVRMRHVERVELAEQPGNLPAMLDLERSSTAEPDVVDRRGEGVGAQHRGD